MNWTPQRILNEAARIEGHPDNVAACVLGAIVASAVDACGVARAVRLELHSHYRIAVVAPDFLLPTVEARQVLPRTYSREDTIFNLQRSTLLIAALISGSGSAFPEALEDRLHQPYRFALVPGLKQITRLRAPGLLGCALSGAGPSVLVFHERGREEVRELVREVFAAHGHDSEIVCAEIASSGYQLDLINHYAHQPPRSRKKSLPAAARAQSGRLVSVGRGGIRESRARKQADFSLGRLFHLPLVPRDGARVVRKRGSGEGPEPSFSCP